MPQTSSSGMSQRQAATAFHCFITTFIFWVRREVRGGVGRDGRLEGALVMKERAERVGNDGGKFSRRGRLH
jgi:hypothetical protein